MSICSYGGLSTILASELNKRRRFVNCVPTQAAIDRLSARFSKKFEASGSQVKVLHNKCLDDFEAHNKALEGFRHSLPMEIVQEARDFILRALWQSEYNDYPQQTFSWECIESEWRFGPGASVGASRNETHTVKKISKPLVCTKAAFPFVKALVDARPHVTGVDYRGYMEADYFVTGSRIATVSKNQEARRVIAIEPLGNMVLQLAFGRYVESALAAIGLNIKSQQDKNKRLARLGSMYRRLATLDLKKASDSNTVHLISDLWPKDCVEFMLMTRSPTAKIRGNEVELNMLSTMGNGFTFPVMTLTFLALVYANSRVYHGGKRYLDWNQYAVYGDDIIVPSGEVSSLVEILSAAGHTVNAEKSCTTGDFRESCGGDYYDGANITPFYVKSLASDEDIYIACNQVLTWSARCGVALPETLAYLLGGLRHKDVLVVPEWMSDSSGLRLRDCPRQYKYLRKEFAKLCVPEMNTGLLMALCAGGYVVSDKYNPVYVARESKSRVRCKKGRLPDGWTDGWDPSNRTSRESHFAQAMFDQLKTLST